MHHPSPDDLLIARLLDLPAAERAEFWQRMCAEHPGLRERSPEVARLLNPDGTATVAAEAPAPLSPGAMVNVLESALSQVDQEAPGNRIGHYKLLQKIGEGGFGAVWMAEQQEPIRRRVALKIVKIGMDTEEVIARFEAERQALALMDHPNIARVFDAGATPSGRPFFVMELVRGVPITHYCDENRLTPEARLRLVVSVCQAVQHAHQKGVIHRDLKPSNILVTLHDGVPVPKVIDFGIAKATDKQLTEKTLVTQFHAFVGTPVYTSPEQMEMSGLDVDTRSDIYSLGVLLYELVAGRPPFDPDALIKSGLDAMRRTIREVDPPRPSNRLGTLPEADRTSVAQQRGTDAAKLKLLLRGDVDWIVMHCLEKDRTRRYETAAALGADLQRHLQQEPIVARPPSNTYRIGKFVRRHRVGVAALAAIALLLVGGLAVSSALFVRERAAHGRAAAAEQFESRLRLQAECVLGFSLTDLREQLDDYGHLPLMRQVADQAVAYYEGLPKGMDSPNLRAGYARALTVLASIHEAQGEPKRSRELLEKSLKLFGDLERAGALTPAMRVDYGFALTSAVILNGNQRLFLEAVPYAERAEAVLRPALADPQQGGLVQRQLATAQFSHGWVLARTGGRARMAVPLVEQAMANAREADRKSPLPRHPGLQAATMAWLLSETLSDSNRARESREINGKARMELRAMLEKEPFLFRAKEPLALCDLRVVTEASADWDYPRLEEALQEGQRLYLEILKYDPKNVTARGVFGNTWTISRRSVDLRNRDYAAAEKAIRTGLPYLADEPTNDRNLARARDAMAQLAWIYAATGRDAEADAALAKAEEYGALANQKRSAGPTAYALSHALRTGLRRFVESARLNWSAVRQNTEETLAALSQIKASMPDESAQMNEFRNDLHLDLMTAAFALGDYATARRALDSVTRLRGKWSPRTGASMQVRFNTSGEQLWKCQVLHRAGEIDEARQLLSTLWPEVEAVFAKAPEVIGNQLRMAWALWIKSEVALGADAAARRVLLERAASYLRPAAAAGKLNRYEREVLLPEVEAGLAGKPAFVPSGRLIAEGLPALRARALAMRNQGDYAAAEPIDRELLALTIKEQGEEGRDVVGNRSILAETLLRVGKLEEAEQLARVVLVGREKDNPPGSYNVATAHRRLGSVLVAQKRFAEAEPLLLKACESTRLRITRSGRSQSESNLLTEGVNSLVDLYAAIGRPEKAAEWKKILADLTGQPLAAPKPPGNP